MAGLDSITMLPEDCLSLILSHTSPLDACRLSSASSAFRSAAYSAIVWDRFLPSDYQEIVERSSTPLNFTSKKELFLLLCQSILMDGGNKSFALDSSTGLKSYILSARDLSITWGNQPMYWSWKSVPGSRFSEVAELRTTWWLEIKGKIKTQMLSSNTTYGAYLIMKVSPRAYGLDSMPLEVSVRVGDRVLANTASVCCPGSTKQQLEGVCYANRTQMLSTEGEARVCPRERKDGWMEIELGEFFSGSESENDEEVNMSLMEVRGYQLKGGLIVEGIEVRPKYQ